MSRRTRQQYLQGFAPDEFKLYQLKVEEAQWKWFAEVYATLWVWSQTCATTTPFTQFLPANWIGTKFYRQDFLLPPASSNLLINALTTLDKYNVCVAYVSERTLGTNTDRLQIFMSLVSMMECLQFTKRITQGISRQSGSNFLIVISKLENLSGKLQETLLIMKNVIVRGEDTIVDVSYLLKGENQKKAALALRFSELSKTHYLRVEPQLMHYFLQTSSPIQKQYLMNLIQSKNNIIGVGPTPNHLRNKEIISLWAKMGYMREKPNSSVQGRDIIENELLADAPFMIKLQEIIENSPIREGYV